VAVSSATKLRVFRIKVRSNNEDEEEDQEEEGPEAQVVGTLKHKLTASNRLAFNSENVLAASSLSTGKVHLLNCNTNKVTASFDLERGNGSHCCDVVFSPCDRWLAVRNTDNLTQVFDMSKDQRHGTLPIVSKHSYTSMTFRSGKVMQLVVTTAENTLYLFDVNKLSLTKWSRENSTKLPQRLTMHRSQVAGAFFDAQNPAIVYLYSTTFICLVDTAKDIVVIQPQQQNGQHNKKNNKKRKHSATKSSPLVSRCCL
jgi:WD40 repeat protein